MGNGQVKKKTLSRYLITLFNFFIFNQGVSAVFFLLIPVANRPILINISKVNIYFNAVCISVFHNVVTNFFLKNFFFIKVMINQPCKLESHMISPTIFENFHITKIRFSYLLVERMHF